MCFSEPFFLSLPPSSGVASLLSSQSHIPFGSLFNFQGTVRRSFTYSHWEAASGKSKSEKYLRIWKVLSLVPTGKSKIIGCLWKIFCFTKAPFTHLDKGCRNAHPFLRFSKKIFLSTENIPSLIWNYKAKWHPISQKKWENIFSVAGALFCLLWKLPSLIPTGRGRMHTLNLKKFFIPSLIWNWEAETHPVFTKKLKNIFFDRGSWFCLLKKSLHLFPLRTAKCTP